MMLSKEYRIIANRLSKEHGVAYIEQEDGVIWYHPSEYEDAFKKLIPNYGWQCATTYNGLDGIHATDKFIDKSIKAINNVIKNRQLPKHNYAGTALQPAHISAAKAGGGGGE